MEKKPDEQKGLFKRLKEGIDDHEEQMVVLGRWFVLVSLSGLGLS